MIPAMIPFLLACGFDVSTEPTEDAGTAGGDSGAGDDSGEPADTAEPDDSGFFPAEGCPGAEEGRQEVESDVAGPYLVMHPLGELSGTVIFMPGSDGSYRSATGTWGAFFDDDPRGYRLVMPWDESGDYPGTAPPVAELIDEIFACFGGDAARVHLIGHSNGGYLAYNVVGPELADRFVSVTGAPGYFTRMKEKQLEGLAFHNAVGENDGTWVEEMESAHEELLAAGFESELTIWPGQAHTPGRNWDGRDGMFDFWDRHAVRAE
jgi:pimeloyl-ACP methyl ester carboxylesterase